MHQLFRTLLRYSCKPWITSQPHNSNSPSKCILAYQDLVNFKDVTNICLETYSKWSHSVKVKEYSVLRWNLLVWWWIISDSEHKNTKVHVCSNPRPMLHWGQFWQRSWIHGLWTMWTPDQQTDCSRADASDGVISLATDFSRCNASWCRRFKPLE